MEKMSELTSNEVMDKEESDAGAAEVDVWKYAFGFVEMAVVKCAIELGIADIIEAHGQPMMLSQLSESLGCSPSLLYRIMRFLVHRRVFKEKKMNHGTTGYDLTPNSRGLTRQGEHSFAALVLLESSPVMLSAWYGLSATVKKDGPPAFEAAHGMDVWSYTAGHPEHSKLIDDAMACNSREVVAAIVSGAADVFDGVATLVDVGGGNGTTLKIVVKACPRIKGINFDLPHVVSVAPESGGVENVGGDMFDRIPKADAVFIKWVLHDWGDDECIQILRKCKEAIPVDKGKVIIVEAVIKEEEEHSLKDAKLLMDMAMMAHTNTGKERTQEEWNYIISQAGFSRSTVRPISTVQSIIEIYP